MFLECTIYEYIKLSYVISDAGHDTLYIFVLDITMCISNCSSATYNGPLANGEPEHLLYLILPCALVNAPVPPMMDHWPMVGLGRMNPDT